MSTAQRLALHKLTSTRPRHPTLDDAFFSIDEFNRLTEELEANNRSRGGLASDEDEEDEEEVGVDLFAPVEEVEDAPVDEEMSEDESDVNGMFYFRGTKPVTKQQS